MANADRMQRLKVLSQNYQNHKGSPEPNKKERMVHQSLGNKAGNMQHLPSAWQEGSQCVHPNVHGMWNHALWPNRPISHPISLWQQIHHGYGGNWQQCDPCWTHEEPQGCQDDTGIHPTPALTQMGWHHPQETCPWQQGIWKHEESHLWHVQTEYGIGATRLPQTQRSRGSHTHFQSPLSQRLSQCSHWLSTKPLGLAAPTNQDHNQSNSTI